MDHRTNMPQENIRRGFSIHQKVVLEIDFSGSLWGYTEITIVPISSELRTIHLHSRQCTIHSVMVASHPADFVHHDSLSSISMSNASDCHNHPELKRKIYSALAENDEGELSVVIPPEVSLRPSGTSSSVNLVSEATTPEPQTPGLFSQTAPLVPEFAPIVIKIHYSLRNSTDGFQFVVPTDLYPYRVPHAYTTPSAPDAARCWIPCVDSIWEKCTWEFEVVVPRYLEERQIVREGDEDELDDVQDTIPTIVVCSGELVEQIAHPYNSNKTIFLFSQAVLTSVHHIALAAGPFHLLSIPADHTMDDSSGSQPPMSSFCLPGHEAMLSASVPFLRNAMNFYTTEFGSYPFGSYKLVFVEELPTPRFDSATLALVTVDLLHGEDAIEQAMETRHALSHALACQWAGVNIHPKAWSDTWLVNGLSLYITGFFLRKFLGNNEYRFKLKKDMQRVLEWDNGSMPPICQPMNVDPPDAATLPFVNLKAPLVLHILDRRLGKSGTSLGLSRVLPKIFLSAISGEMPNNALSTHIFLRTCRKVSGVDPRSFAEQWIYGSGCPAFGFSASFSRKKMAVEITMRQEAPAYRVHQNNEISRTLMKPVPFFEGQMTVRIHEADGTPYEHVLDIRSPFKRYEVPFNTKYKRIRRNTKRYLARQAAAQAAAEGDTEAAEAMGMVDMGFGLEIWEKEKERENWKVADWTEEEEQVMSGATYEWIRMDADFEWIAAVAFDQPDFMWVSQLQRDRDVVAQLEAVHALARQPTAIVSSTLTKTVLVSNYYHRIRCEAALALVSCAIRRLDFLGLFHLFKLFLRYCYDPEDPNQDLFAHTYVPKPNNFSDLAEYFVRKSLINAIASVRFENGKSPSVVRRFLIDLLRYNDNTANPYSDGFYICTIITAAACAAVSTSPPERGELLTTEVRIEHNAEDVELLKQTIGEVDRYRSMDRLIPSSHNIVTIAALEFHLILSLASLVPSHARVFFPLTREGNYTQVRIAAFDGLFMTKWYTPQVMRYVLAVMANDSSRAIRRHIARSACQSLALLVTTGEIKSSLKETESLLIEEDGTAPEKSREMAKKSEIDNMIKALRKDREVGKNEVLREFLIPIALAPDVDYEVRWCILKLADLVIRGVEETAPKFTIHLPPTPVTESAPPLPLVKPPPKVQRSIKSGGTHKHPLVPITVPPKFKIPVNSQTPVTAGIPATPHPKGVKFTVPALPAKAKVKKPTVKKPRFVPKAQSGGMSVQDLRACQTLLLKIKPDKHAHVFLQPVDPIRDHAPDYFRIIKQPMDLSTMTVKLSQGLYRNRFEVEADFRLMIENAKLYNAVGSYVHNQAIGLESIFEKRWARINKTLEAAAAQRSASAAAPPPITSAAQVPSATTSVPSEPTTQPPKDTTPTPLPTIKLKVNSTQSKPAEVPKPPKPKIRKPKVVEAPPPYIDDGSHDLLQEVIAMEMEKAEEKRQRLATEREKEKIVENGSAKRKQQNLSGDEDEILALATPSKKERPSPAGPSNIIPEETSVGPSLTRKSILKSGQDSTSEPNPPSDVLRTSVKGKEKEVPALPTKTKKLPTPSEPTPVNEKKCKDVLKALHKIPEAAIFLRPVDPVVDGCPTYLEEIEHPMDFGTISRKLAEGKYQSMEDFGQDIELVFSNCRKFNPPQTYPVDCADTVENVYKKEWAKATEKKLTWAEKRGLQGITTTLVKEDVQWIFREPVDPIALGIPTYFDIITRKDARDLKMIRQKLDADKYDSIDTFDADIDLMVRNAIKFNGADSEVGLIAAGLRARATELLANVRSGATKKRKEGENDTPQPTKKPRIGEPIIQSRS